MLRRFLPILVVSVASVTAAGASAPAYAQGDESSRESDRVVDEAVERLRNNPFFATYPERVRDLVDLLVEQRTPRADEALRKLLADPATPRGVVEKIAIACLHERTHRFVEDVAERLRRDGGGELERRLAATLLACPPGTVRRLAELARDADRTPGSRLVAIRLLGLTGDALALDTLAALWAGPEKEYREPARDAFDAIVPGGAASAAEASALAATLRREDVPLSEILRRLLRERNRVPAQTTGAVATSEYAALAREFLPRATLDQVIRLYVLGSPVPEVREMAVRRLAEFPWDASGETDGRLRAARALFEALRREDSAAVESAILGTLATLAPTLRGNVSSEEVQAVLLRLPRSRGTPRESRLLATKLLGELRDERALEGLQSEYDALGDGDPDGRFAILEALQQIPADLTPWFVQRIEGEANGRLVRKLVVLLHRGRDPAALACFRNLLATHPDQQVRWDVAKAVGTLWAGTGTTEARDVLLEVGLADADATVRTTCVAALGFPGPGKEAVVRRLQGVVGRDLDARVRLAAAKSIVDLDEAAAARNLAAFVADDAETWALLRDHLVDGLQRRDRTPERILEAAGDLAAANLRGRAIDLLERADALRPEVWDDAAGRSRMRERLVRLQLDERRPADAERTSRALLAAAGTDEDARRRAELLLAESLTASGVREKLLDAERRLEALAADARLDGLSTAVCAATLGACRLGLDDPLGALDALSAGAASDLPAPVRLRIEALVDEARAKTEEEKKRVMAWVEALSAPDAAAAETARTGLRSLGWRAARHLVRAADGARDLEALRRLLAAAEVVCGRPVAVLPASPTDAQVAAAGAAVREALGSISRPARISGTR